MMPISHKDLIAYSYENKRAHKEVTRRSSVSRGYYACYHILIEKLHFYEGIIGKSTHQALIEYLTSKACNSEPYDIKTLKALGLTLKQQKANRVKADYDLSFEFDDNIAESCVERIKGLYHRVEQLKELSD